MIDTHCHVQFKAYKDDSEIVMKKCQDAGMILNIVGSQQTTSARAVEYAQKYDFAFATIGVHPVHLFPTFVDEAESGFQSRQETCDYEYYKTLAQNKKVALPRMAGPALIPLLQHSGRECADGSSGVDSPVRMVAESTEFVEFVNSLEKWLKIWKI